MDLTYQQVLAEIMEDDANNQMIFENLQVDDVDREPYEKYDYEVNELENQEKFNEFHGNRNVLENVIRPDSYQGTSSDIKHHTNIKLISLNIDSGFRGNIVPASSANCSGSLSVVPGTSSSHFSFLSSKEYKNITSVKLTSMEFHNTFYAFSALRGNTSFSIIIGATTFNIKIPDGNYPDYNTFTGAIQTAIVALIPTSGFTVTYSSTRHRITINATTNFTITFPATETNPFGNGIGYNMGFLLSSYSVAPITGLTSDQVPNIFPDTYVYLQINDWNLVDIQQYPSSFFSVFSKIQLPPSSKNSIVLVNNFSDSSTKIYRFQQPVNIQKLEIRIIDSYGNILDLLGGNFSMTLELEQVKNSSIYEKLLEL